MIPPWFSFAIPAPAGSAWGPEVAAEQVGREIAFRDPDGVTHRAVLDAHLTEHGHLLLNVGPIR